MKRAYLIASLLLLCSLGIHAQKLKLEVDQLTTNTALNPQRLQQANWIGQSNRICYWQNQNLIAVDVVSGRVDTLTSLLKINALLGQDSIIPLPDVPKIQFTNDHTFGFFHDNRYLHVDILAQKKALISSIPENASNISRSPDDISLTYNNDRVLLLLKNGMKYTITTETGEGLSDGWSVYRKEFNTNKGVFWSPDSRQIAYYRLDERMVSNYPLVNTDTRVATLKNEPYPMAGMKSHQTQIYIYNTENFNTTVLRTNFPKDQYLTNIAWAPDGKTLYVAHLNREQNHLEMKAYSTQTGNYLKPLFEEKHARYVEPERPALFVPGRPDLFLWTSARDGYKHLYLYDINGKMIRQVTQGAWDVKDIIGFSPKGDQIYFTASKESPITTDLYAASVTKNSAIQRLTSAEGQHRIKKADNGRYFLDEYSNLNTPYVAQILDLKGRVVRELSRAENPLANYQVGKTELFTLKAADGIDLWARMIKPHDFDSTKKYPVLVYVYNGPHSQMIDNSWLGKADKFFYVLAEAGYLVFTVDGRGTSYRGFEFESCIHRQLGEREMADQLSGVAYLKSLPYIDSTRIGVDGWSYGGFMSISLKLRHPGVFKVATAGGPVIDWKWYEVMYGERYMDTPEENPEGYQKASLLNYVDKLQGKLLIIHGAQDATVVWQNSLQFIEQCIKLNKQVDYFVYPSHPHNVRGADRGHLYQKLLDYYQANL